MQEIASDINNSLNNNKYIRTATGVKFLKDFSKNSLCLPYEHICQNICDFLMNFNHTRDEDIALKNISDVTVNQFGFLKNLYLDSDVTKSADELSLLKEYNCEMVIDSTTKKNGQNLKNLRDISNLSGISICFGYTLKEDFFNYRYDYNFDKIHNEIRYELVYGYDDMIPSFLGEIIISDGKQFPNKNEENFFEILFKLVEEFNIPLFIKLNKTSFDCLNTFDYFEKKLSNYKFERKLIVFICTFEEPNENLLKMILENILKKGYSIIYTIYECDLVVANKLKESNIINQDFFTSSFYYSRSKLEFIKCLINLENKKYISQIMLSNGVNFRIQLKKYGGFGYVNFFKNYFFKIIEISHLNNEEINIIFRENLLNLLSWWEPPKKNIKKVKMITCSQ
jgi:hypothetical protein